jgi:hypothetical protein
MCLWKLNRLKKKRFDQNAGVLGTVHILVGGGMALFVKLKGEGPCPERYFENFFVNIESNFFFKIVGVYEIVNGSLFNK